MGDYIFSMTLPVTYEPLRIVDEYVQYLGYKQDWVCCIPTMTGD